MLVIARDDPNQEIDELLWHLVKSYNLS